ncbi:MAG TPA: rhodanese-like domain-containing protein [Terriglobales bacterium]|jgi:membrane protein DedA with SNARE-associated domain/rhodanese-related sulfurtransferase
MHRVIIGVGHHGYLLLVAAVFVEAIGLPIPAALVMIGAGAAAASHALSLPLALLLSLLALLSGDFLLFTLGRYTGWALLGILCRVSVNPETCILRSAESFYKRGKITLVFAKFVPGVNTIAPPLAGSMKMRPLQFLSFDFMGATLYATTFLAVGFVFRDFLAAITRGFIVAGRAVEISLVAAILVYMIYRLWVYQKHAVYRVVPRIQVQELARKLASDEKSNILLLDVRSHGYYDSGAERIKGSLRLEPNNFADEIKHLSRDKEIYLYCTCARDATSARVAHLLREHGFNAFVIVGGLGAWRKAGLPMEGVPNTDLVKLPTFS